MLKYHKIEYDHIGMAYQQLYWGVDEVNFTEYQQLGQVTANKEMEHTLRLAIAGLGISGEAGEVAELIKKYIGHGHYLDRDSLKKELGDVLWYIQEIAYLQHINLEEIAIANIEKLKKRYPEGFTTERSINRNE